jgi:hypothetical protein
MTITPASPAAPQQAAVDAALLVLKSMGLTLEDLAAPGNGPGRVPPHGPRPGHQGALGHHHPRVLPPDPGPGHGDRPGPHAAEDTAAADRAQTDAPGPTTRVRPAWHPAQQSGDQPNQNPPDRTAAEPRPPGRTKTAPRHDGHAEAEFLPPVSHAAEPANDHARDIARQLAWAGQRISRRALRSRGVKGSNQALNALALRLSAELAIDTAGCS